jgi:hypothetical protein
VFILFIIPLVLVSNEAMASKARLLSMSQSVNGSNYISDSRNIFLNPALILKNKDIVVFEWGSTGSSGDSDTNPNAEAGIIKETGRFVYGAFFGNEHTEQSGLRSGLTDYYAGTSEANVDNAFDVFIAGQAGIDWGVSLTNSSSETESNNIDQSLKILKIGLAQSNWKFALHYVLANEVNDSDTPANVFETNSDTKFVFNYNFRGISSYLNYRTYETETVDFSGLIFGFAKVRTLNDKVKLYTSFELLSNSTDTSGAEATQKSIPMTVALEADLKSWLVVRMSIVQNLWSSDKDISGNRSTQSNSTNVNAGATLKFSEITIDGVIGTGDGGSSTAVDTDSEQGILTLDNLLTRVSMTYKF